MKRAAILAWVTLTCAVLVGCGGSSIPPPLAGEAPSGAVGGSPGASPVGSAGASGAAASGGSPSAPAGFSEAQGQLFGSIRADAQVGCAPRTDNLPPKATDGIDCTVGSNLVNRVGVYRFATPGDALAAYIARMASYGVALRSGDCLAGKAGDVSWTPGDGPEEGGDSLWRTGCFIDENGKANVRLTCGTSPTGDPGPGRYIGILGASNKIRPLLDWATAYAEGVDVPVPAQPGICFNAAVPAPR
jgi:hypothetical protein